MCWDSKTSSIPFQRGRKEKVIRMKFICTNFNTLSLNFANFSLFRQILTLNFLGFKLPQLITNLPQRVSRIRRYLTKILSEHNWGIKAGQTRKSIEIESRSLRSSLLGLVWQEVLARNFLYVISNIPKWSLSYLSGFIIDSWITYFSKYLNHVL